MSGYFNTAKAFLSCIEKACQPLNCLFSDNDFFVNILDQISSAIIEISINPDLREIVSRRVPSKENLHNLLLKNDGEILSSDHEHIHFKLMGFGFFLKELQRANFSGNGNEEVLCSIDEYSIEGTHGLKSLFLLKKDTPRDLAYPVWIRY